jgi:hypothetical protein
MSNNQYFGLETYFNEKATFYKEIEVSGNVYIDSGNLIISSENGIKYKLIVSDSGNLSTVAL